MSCTEKHRDGYIPDLGIRTDLAVEAREEVEKHRQGEIPGLETDTEQDDGITINRVHIKNREASMQLGKPPGKYVTLEAPELKDKNVRVEDRLSVWLSREVEQVAELKDREDVSVMVVGLGNWNVTPDSLGPKVVEDLLVTRHVFELKQEKGMFSNGFRSVSAFSPGVMGLTGIETGEIIQSIAARVKPDLVIAVDALAAHRLERMHTTVQITNTGVIPGSGVQNRRLGITEETIGVPVIAVGVPTVVEASTIVGGAMEAIVRSYQEEKGESAPLGVLGNFNWNEKQELIREVLVPFNEDRLMVTPKEIDDFADNISQVIAGGLNTALHPKMSENGGGKYLQ